MTSDVWQLMTDTEQLLCDAASRRRDRGAFERHWLDAAVRIATDARIDPAARALARSCFSEQALRRLDEREPGQVDQASVPVGPRSYRRGKQ